MSSTTPGQKNKNHILDAQIQNHQKVT